VSDRPATAADVHRVAAAMPHVTRADGPRSNPIYQVGGKSFVFVRTPRPDAPFFTTDHFNGHRSVLVRSSDLHRVGVEELTELIQDAWLSQASKRRGEQWLASR
jgi:hypothetical protein